MSHDEVPMMFRAQVENRCQLQRVIKGVKRQDSHLWVDDWMKVFPETMRRAQQQPSPSKPSSQKPGQSHAVALARPSRPPQTNMALARAPKPGSASSQQDITSQIPNFGQGVQTRDYTITWRFVSNSGQDEGVIRPIIGAKGFPFYPGASMKGAFLRGCTPDEALKYCGGKLSLQKTKPGILRFHGAYPVDMNWTNRLVDIIHSQQEKQVIADQVTNANAQISLYQAKLKFGISSTKPLENPEWDRIWEIWEQALAEGIGSRVSAGYGQFQEVTRDNTLLQVKLKGQGIASTLIEENNQKIPEFRPNMFKAALRGHTLRLLGGLTDEATARQVTQTLWGGFGDSKKPIVGCLGIGFEPKKLEIEEYKYKPSGRDVIMPTYHLENGILTILDMHSNLSEEQKDKLEKTAKALVQFSLLLGGFGKSWRRADHSLFYKSYLENSSKPMIGCHWQFIDDDEDESVSFYHPVNALKDDVKTLIDDIIAVIRLWIPSDKLVSQGIQKWREPWHHQKVQVWGRLAENGKSKAIRWFHGAYNSSESIKNPHVLSGSMGHTGRIWHRMYPRYVTNEKGEIKPGNGYVELLTIFPDGSQKTQNFLSFLDSPESGFHKVW